MKKLLPLFAYFLVGANYAQTKPTQVLLIGTFHFNNPGADVAKMKTFDVMTPNVQAELETLTDKIHLFHSDKVFVEWPWNEQSDLDALYAQYLGGTYEQYVTAKYLKPAQ